MIYRRLLFSKHDKSLLHGNEKSGCVSIVVTILALGVLNGCGIIEDRSHKKADRSPSSNRSPATPATEDKLSSSDPNMDNRDLGTDDRKCADPMISQPTQAEFWTLPQNIATYAEIGTNLINDLYICGKIIYAATDQGLSISTDSGSTWVTKTTSNGLKDNRIRAVFASGSMIYPAT